MQCSYLGYGLMAGRAAVLGEERFDANPCVPTGFTGTYEYGGNVMEMKPHKVQHGGRTCTVKMWLN